MTGEVLAAAEKQEAALRAAARESMGQIEQLQLIAGDTAARSAARAVAAEKHAETLEIIADQKRQVAEEMRESIARINAKSMEAASLEHEREAATKALATARVQSMLDAGNHNHLRALAESAKRSAENEVREASVHLAATLRKSESALRKARADSYAQQQLVTPKCSLGNPDMSRSTNLGGAGASSVVNPRHHQQQQQQHVQQSLRSAPLENQSSSGRSSMHSAYRPTTTPTRNISFANSMTQQRPLRASAVSFTSTSVAPDDRDRARERAQPAAHPLPTTSSHRHDDDDDDGNDDDDDPENVDEEEDEDGGNEADFSPVPVDPHRARSGSVRFSAYDRN